MAQGFTSFGNYPVGLQPFDWSAPAGLLTATVESVLGTLDGQVLRLTPTDRWRGIFWDVVGSTLNGEVAMRMRVVQPLLNFGMATGGWMRAKDDVVAAMDNSYGGGYRNDTTNRLNITRDRGTELTSLGVTAQGSSWYQIRVRSNGSTHELWQWDDAAPPKFNTDTPDLSTTDSTHLTAGSLGVQVDHNPSPGTVIEIDWFGYGTDGDEAPIEPVGPGGDIATYPGLNMALAVGI